MITRPVMVVVPKPNVSIANRTLLHYFVFRRPEKFNTIYRVITAVYFTYNTRKRVTAVFSRRRRNRNSEITNRIFVLRSCGKARVNVELRWTIKTKKTDLDRRVYDDVEGKKGLECRRYRQTRTGNSSESRVTILKLYHTKLRFG